MISAGSQKRNFLSRAAIAWGMVAILMLLAFGQGLRNQMMRGRRGMGENIAVWWPGNTSKVWQGLPQGRAIRPRLDDVDDLRRRMTAATGVTSSPPKPVLRFGSTKGNSYLLGLGRSEHLR